MPGAKSYALIMEDPDAAILAWGLAGPNAHAGLAAEAVGVAGGHLKIVALKVSEHVGGHLARGAQVRAHAQGGEG
ncbi:hypothetical protein [Pseudoxanthomonas winnipegensis]|uniref:hypothetical protein n=1 Tax=Pseudoxanthomonas winnipegensis TaxID=2480810 RepID=UPI003CCCFC65